MRLSNDAMFSNFCLDPHFSLTQGYSFMSQMYLLIVLPIRQRNLKCFKQKKIKKGEHNPRADGVLIFDEVKVVTSLLWNSCSQKIVGLAMTSEDHHYMTSAEHLMVLRIHNKLPTFYSSCGEI